ncbi:MAG: GGDEF domain-containing protein [Oscillospiraceae bacterium]|nr:GGDEF domain-containing protein [Oscillospiraceae bacterium]
MLFGYKIAAVCVAKPYEDVIREFLESLHKILTPQQWRLFIYTTGSELFWNTQADKGEKAIFDLIRPDYVDLLVVIANTIKSPESLKELCDRAKNNNIPLIVINDTVPDSCSITFDFTKGFGEVVRHLITCHSITDFHLIAGMKDNAFSDERIDIMRRVMQEYGLSLSDSQISYGDFWSVPAREATEKLIQEKHLPQAIVCANDTMAIAVCTTLAQHQIRVPEDVIVTGFDGIDSIYYSMPKLTSCKCDYTELGRETARLILELENGTPLPEHVTLIPHPVLLESCGCKPIQMNDTVDFINNLNDSFTRFQREGEDLSGISAKIKASETIQEVAQYLTDNRLYYNMTCMLKTECIDDSLDPLTIHSETTFGKELYILADTDVPYPPEQLIIPADALIPRLKVYLDAAVPAIFTALHAIDIPLGYLCFHFGDFSKQNYIKINQTAMSLSSALSGFRNAHYQKHLQTTLEAIYQFDSLTGLYSRKAFHLRLAHLLEAQKFDALTLVLCDLDGLKYINDTFSHTEGDNAIAVSAKALKSACKNGLCCRYGGDELIGLLTLDCDASQIRNEIQSYLDDYNQHSGKPYQVSASIGIYTAAVESFESMFEKADALMYEEKKNKPNRRK